MNSVLESKPRFLTSDEINEQLAAQGKAIDGNVIQDIYKLEQAIRATALANGPLTAPDNFVPVTNPQVITHLNGGTWPEARFVVFHNARVCLPKDIPHIEAMDKITTTDVNHPADTGKLAAAMAL